MDRLTSSDMAQLQEVSDGMLDIYRTLARMRYLDPSWIHEGPHNIDALLPKYHSLGLDPAVIYLYSILPYVDTGGAKQVDFFQGGKFADFRCEQDVRTGRDPFYAQSEDEAMRPWMTPLSLLGNHRTVIIYDARTHRIGMFDQISGGSTDPNFHEEDTWIQPGEEGEGDDEEENAETADEDADEDEEGENEDEDEDEEDCDDDEEEEGDSEEGENVYDEMDSRPAVNVLRDIVKWYNELVETPGGGEQTGGEWKSELLIPLYRKNGWPDMDFDGDAFLVDLIRARAAEGAKWDAEEQMQRVRANQGSIQGEGSEAMQFLQGRLAVATTLDEEWQVHWQLWQLGRRNEQYRKGLKEAEAAMARVYPDGICQKPDDLPLWELWKR